MKAALTGQGSEHAATLDQQYQHTVRNGLY
jgi:hypothetical protein